MDKKPLMDKNLVCVGCQKEFTFTAGEQAFFAEKGFVSDPKRCKACRIARRKKSQKRTGEGVYRSPAFEDSAPSHQKMRGRQYRPRGSSDYRAPASFGKSEHEPDMYRSPAFPEHSEIKPEDEYRAPGFREYEDIDAAAEYRAPGYQASTEAYHDEKPLFAIVCASCGQDAMVPVLPEEKEILLCQDCYRADRAARAAEDTASTESAESTEATAEVPDTPTAVDTSDDPQASDTSGNDLS